MQCIGTAIQGAFWGGTVGCDVMGFYSALASYSSQMATLLMAFLTYRIALSKSVPKWQVVGLCMVTFSKFCGKGTGKCFAFGD